MPELLRASRPTSGRPGRRIAGATGAVIIATLASMFFGPSAVFAAYYSTCGAGNNFQAFVYHSGVSSGIKDYASETYGLKSPHACTGGSSGQTSFAFPISSQDGSCEQLGWGQQTGTSGLHWFYTEFDNDGCDVAAAGSGFPAIVVGHDYHFRVFLTSNASCGIGTMWEYYIQDLTTGGSGHQCGTYSALATFMWDGFEVGTSQDELGGAGSGNKSTIGASCWATSVGGTYSCINDVGYSTSHTDQSYWVKGDTHDIDGNSQMWAYTNDH